MKVPILLGISAIAVLLPAAAMADANVSNANNVTVKVEADEPVPFEHRMSENDPWELACNAPCEVSVPGGDEFRFAPTNDANETKVFNLKTDQVDQNGRITVQHHRNSKTMYKAAPWIIAGSAAVFIGGIVMATIGITKAHGVLADGSTEQTNAITGAGTFLILAGVGGGWYGAAALVNDRYSAATGDLRTLDSPQTKGQNPAARGTAFLVPIFSGHF